VLCFSFKYLEETYNIKFDQSVFCDCMGVGLQAAVVASTFMFAETVSIECSEVEAKKTQKILNASSFELAPIYVRTGRLQVIVNIYL
jgi:hypothetical protein